MKKFALRLMNALPAITGAFVVSLMLLLPLGPSQAVEAANSVALPERVFDLPRAQFNTLVTDIITEATAINSAESNAATLQRVSRLSALVAQFERYKTAMESLDYVDGNAVYADVVTAEKRLAEKGVTTEKLALLGTEMLVSLGDWPALNDSEFEKREVIFANFLAEIHEPALSVKANIDFAELFDTLGKRSVALDRYKEAIERSKFVIDLDKRNAFEIELAGRVSILDDPRKFGLLTMLLRGTNSQQQQNIVEAVAKSWSRAPKGKVLSNATPPDQTSKLSLAWKTRLSMELRDGSAPKLEDIVSLHTSDIDTSSLVVLLSGSLGEKRDKVIDSMVINYLAKGLELRAFNLVMALPDDESNIDNRLMLASKFAESGYSQFSQDIVKTIGPLTKPVHAAPLSKEQQAMLVSVLVRNGDGTRLKHEFREGFLAGSKLDQSRILLQSRIQASLNSPSGRVDPFTDDLNTNVPTLGDSDLYAVVKLINGDLPDESLFSENSNEIIPALWTRAGSQLWSQHQRRQMIVDFVKGSAPRSWKVALVKGVTANLLFDPLDDDGKLLFSAVRDVGLVKEFGDGNDPVVDGLNQRRDGDFGSRAKAIIDIENYTPRVEAFRGLAMQQAQKLDTNHWLGPSHEELGAFKKASAEDIVLQTDVSGERNAVSVSLKSSNSAFLQSAARRPEMPNFNIGNDSVYSQIPMPGQGEVGTTIGGETRIERLTRFASEYYRDISNLGVRDHIYLSNRTITPKFIFLRSGVVSMDQLLAKIAPFNPELLSEEGGTVLLRAPIVVGPDATLILSGKEFSELRLSKQKGAFLINAGKIYFSDINITGYDEEAKAPATVLKGELGHEFRPFILNWSGSKTFATNSKFEALGYPAGRAYGFSMSSGPADDISAASKPAAPSGLIVNNSFVNLYYGFYAFEVNAAQLIGNEYRDSIIYGIDPHDRSKDLVMAFNSAYGTHKKHGIIISREVDDSFIVGNLSFDNAGSGVMLDRESVGTVVYANTLVDNKGDGFAAFESPCALVSNNYVAGNSRVGIKVRNSWDVQIERNTVRNNGVAGVEGYIDRLEGSKGSAGRNYVQDPYSPVTTLTVVRNVFEGNPAGLELHGATAATVYGNSFVNQAPKLFVGDAKKFAIDILAKGDKTPVTVTANCIPKISKRKMCSLTQQGVIVDHSSNRDFIGSEADGDYCLKKAGSIQANALEHVK
jgi:parallel beta-helix repeat protein